MLLNNLLDVYFKRVDKMQHVIIYHMDY